MLEPVVPQDLPAVRALIAAAIRHSVARSDSDAAFLIDDVGSSLEWWQENPERGLHLKYVAGGAIVGVILVKDHWNLANLFVAPDQQRRGIARALLAEVLRVCRVKSPRAAFFVNSSSIATGFYERVGFRQSGPARDRPGGCVPYRYDF